MKKADFQLILFLCIITLSPSCKENNKHIKRNNISHVASDSFYLTGFYSTVDTTNGYNVRQIEVDTGKRYERLPEPDSTYFFLNPQPVILVNHFTSVNVSEDELGNPSLEIELDEEGTKIFGEASAKAINKYLAFIIDNKLICTAIVIDKINGGKINMPMKRYSKEKLEEFKELIENEK